jgi:hypothetical protein
MEILAHPAVVIVSTFRPAGYRAPFPQQIHDIVNLLIQQIHLARQALDLGLRATVDFKIQFTAQPIFGVQAILGSS